MVGFPQGGMNARVHFRRGFGGEGEREYLVYGEAAFHHEVNIARGKHPCFAGSGSRGNHGVFIDGGRLLLIGIQGCQNFMVLFHLSPAR